MVGASLAGILMDCSFPLKYLALRVLIIALNVYGVASYPENQSNVGWPVGFIIGGATSVGLFAWLTLIRSKRDVDWSAPYSWTKPFFPMQKYPVRFWLLGAFSFVVAGGVTILVDMALRNGHSGFGGTFLCWGLGPFITLQVWMRIFGGKQQTE